MLDLSKLERDEPETFNPNLHYSEFLCKHVRGKKQGRLFIKVSSSPLCCYGNDNYFNGNRDYAIRKIKNLY